jgi:hypothetical protein
MRFMQAFRYILDRPGGLVNLLLIVVCQFIPVVGRIVVLGYRAEVSVALDHDPKMMRHPKFDFNRFGEYLARGVWPFLIDLLLRVPQFFFLFVLFFVSIAVNLQGPNNFAFMIFIIMELCYVLAELLHFILSVPMQFHAEITGRFDLGGAYRFTCSFWSTVGWVAIGTGLVFAFLACLVFIAGLLFFCVGIYPAHALIEMAGQHLMVQLYRVYLARGGEPLEEYEPPLRDDRDDEFDDEEEYEEEEYEDERR